MLGPVLYRMLTMQIMNAIKTTCQIESSIAHFVRRGAMLIALLLTFVTEVSAQKYYVIYYDDTSTTPATRHYLSISENGESLTNETTLSLRCYWVADGDLVTAIGERDVDYYVTNRQINTTNEGNRKILRSYLFPGKNLMDEKNARPNNQGIVPYNITVTDNVEEKTRWLIDNEDNTVPVFYIWYYKQYVYYDNGWKYSYKGHEMPNSVKIEPRSVYPPQISVEQNVNGSYQVSLTAAENCKIYYTTDGTEPEKITKNEYKSSFSAIAGITVKAIAVGENVPTSSVAVMTLPTNLTVTLDDREDHSWTYYSGVNKSVDRNYNSNYEGKLYSPQPRNVEITYNANGGAVSNTEHETSFLYKKTLESKKENDAYTYSYVTIANPFSKRPSRIIVSDDEKISKEFYGFAGWRVVTISGGTISGEGIINEYKLGDETFCMIPPETEIKFKFEGNYTENCTSAKLKLEAVWIPASVTYLTSVPVNGVYEYSIGGGTYETNFLVLKCNPTSITLNSPCTIMMVEPDGSVDYRESCTFTGSIVPSSTGTTKIEFAHWNPAAAIDAKGKNYTIGRGMVMDGNSRHLYGTATADVDVDQILKVESGIFNQFIHFQAQPSSVKKQRVILGCDYDRANDDNSKLKFFGKFLIADNKSLGKKDDEEICRVYSLSGKFMTNLDVSNANYDNCYYMSVLNRNNNGLRYLEILGGEWVNIAGGRGDSQDEGMPAFTFRMRGGTIKGAVYGAAEYINASGTRTFVITGGTIKGWIAGGANGTTEAGGQLLGSSYIYVGGKARIDSQNKTSNSAVINRAVGGNVFGAGCGYSATSTSGQVTLGTNVVIADNAYVERGVYGGGSYGYTEATSNIYITGGTIGGNVGGVTINENDNAGYSEDIQGGVYGGACQNKGGNVNIYMTGGTVNGGIYGGSNASGTLSGDVTMKITGGNVGESSQKTASVYGGGYGGSTTVNGSTNITMTGGTVNGNVFGGGNQGTVNNNASVTITGGTVIGNVYGGGNEAAVGGQTRVVIGSDGN